LKDSNCNRATALNVAY